MHPFTVQIHHFYLIRLAARSHRSEHVLFSQANMAVQQKGVLGNMDDKHGWFMDDFFTPNRQSKHVWKHQISPPYWWIVVAMIVLWRLRKPTACWPEKNRTTHEQMGSKMVQTCPNQSSASKFSPCSFRSTLRMTSRPSQSQRLLLLLIGIPWEMGQPAGWQSQP